MMEVCIKVSHANLWQKTLCTIDNGRYLRVQCGSTPKLPRQMLMIVNIY